MFDYNSSVKLFLRVRYLSKASPFIDRDKSQDLSSIREVSPPVMSGGGGQESLSVVETNRLRAKLGLKPLEVAEKVAG